MQNTLVKLQTSARDLIFLIRRKDIKAATARLSKVLCSGLYHHIEYLVFARALTETLPSAEARVPLTYRVATIDDRVNLRGLVLPSDSRLSPNGWLMGEFVSLPFIKAKLLHTVGRLAR